MSIYDPLTGEADHTEMYTVDERTATFADELPHVHNPATVFEPWPPDDDRCVEIATGYRRSGRHRAYEPPAAPPVRRERAVPIVLHLFHAMFGVLLVGCVAMAFLLYRWLAGDDLRLVFTLQWVFAATLTLTVWMFSAAMLRHLERCRG